MATIISIHAREHPILIKEKLMTFVPANRRNDPESISEKRENQSSLSGIKNKLEEGKNEETISERKNQ